MKRHAIPELGGILPKLERPVEWVLQWNLDVDHDVKVRGPSLQIKLDRPNMQAAQR